MGNIVSVNNVDGVTILRLERADKHNALIPELLDELRAALDAVAADPAARVVVLEAAGKSFSTGGDLKWFLSRWDNIGDAALEIVGKLNQTMLAMRDCPVPIIAAVQGWTTGGSMGLVLASDLVVATEDARFGPYYTEVGYSPDGGWSVLLPRIIGARAAAETQYLNQPLSAHDALRLGLVNQLVRDNPSEPARQWATRIAGMVGESVRSTKRLLHADSADWADLLEQERQAFVARITAPETKANVLRFLESMRH